MEFDTILPATLTAEEQRAAFADLREQLAAAGGDTAHVWEFQQYLDDGTVRLSVGDNVPPLDR